MNHAKELKNERRLHERFSVSDKAKIYSARSKMIYNAELMNESCGGYGIQIECGSDLVGEEILVVLDKVVNSCVVVRQSYGSTSDVFIGAKIIPTNKNTIAEFIKVLNQKKAQRKRRTSLKTFYYPGSFRI